MTRRAAPTQQEPCFCDEDFCSDECADEHSSSQETLNESMRWQDFWRAESPVLATKDPVSFYIQCKDNPGGDAA